MAAWLEGFKRKLFCNIFIRLIIEVYLDIIVAAGVRLIMHEMENRFEIGMTIFAAFMILFAAAFLITTLLLIVHNKKRLQDEDFKVKYGELIESLDTNVDLAAYYWIFFMVHRITQCAITVFL